MAEFDLHREFHDELLSAYLDGELSADERVRVEERLAVDPVARQMLEDLRSVSQAMQGLPVEKVGEDLRPIILQRAQEALNDSRKQQAATSIALATASTANGRDPAAATTASTPAGSSSRLQLPEISIGRTRRGWVWAAAAVAAAVLIMVVQRSEERDGGLPNLASRDVERSESTRRSQDENGEQYSFDDRDKIAAQANESSSDRLLGRSMADELRESELRESAGTPAELSLPDLPTDSFTKNRYAEGRDATEAEAASRGGMVAEKSERLRDATAAPPAQPLRYDLAADATTALAEGTDQTDVATRATARNEPTSAATATDALSMSRSVGENKGLLDRDGRERIAAAKETAAPIESANAPIRERLLVVVVNVRRDASSGRAFDQKLADNQIALDVATTANPTQPPIAAAPVGGRESLVRDDLASDYYANWSFIASSVRELSEAEAILVEAPPEQMERLLGALDADAENVVSLSVSQLDSAGKVASAELPTDVDWTKYRRVNTPQPLREMSQQLAGGPIPPPVASDAPASLGPEATGGRGRAAGRGGRGGRGGGRGAARGGGSGGGRGGAVALSDSENQSGADKQGAAEGAAPRGGGFGGGGAGRVAQGNGSFQGNADGFGGVGGIDNQGFGAASDGRGGAGPMPQRGQQPAGDIGNLGQSAIFKQDTAQAAATNRGALDASGLDGVASGKSQVGQGIDTKSNEAAVPMLGRAKRIVLQTSLQPGEQQFLNLDKDADVRQRKAGELQREKQAADQATASVVTDLSKTRQDSRAKDKIEERIADGGAASEPAADRTPDSRELNTRGQILPSAAQSAAARQTVQVLFVLRPEPASTAAATSAPAGPTTPATSPPAADPAK